MANFVLQFPLKTEKYQEDILDKRLEIGKRIYNSLVTVTQKRYKEMIRTKKYRNLLASLSDNKKENKIIWKEITALRKQYNLSEYSFHKDVKKMQRHFKENIDAFTAQKIATHLWQAYDKLLFGDGEKIHYRKYGQFNSVEGKTNTTGIRFKNDTLFWKGLEIPVVIDYHNPYEAQALESKIAYCRIVRKYVRNRYKYYVQIIFKGHPPLKLDKNTGVNKRKPGRGDVGIDIGVSTIAIASETNVKLLELADKAESIEQAKRRLLRKMDRSRRATNPDNFDDDGTIKKQGAKKVTWIRSNHYEKDQYRLRELYRKQAAIRKYQHECLANDIIALGNQFYVETMNFKALQKRAKKTEKNDKGRYKRKKRFGKTLANRAPSMLLTIIKRKLSFYELELTEIDTWNAKASQFNHFDQTYTKKALSKRWNNFGAFKIQRDLYSAFLIMNSNEDLKSFNLDKCNTRFEHFKTMHDQEIKRLENKKNLSCMGI